RACFWTSSCAANRPSVVDRPPEASAFCARSSASTFHFASSPTVYVLASLSTSRPQLLQSQIAFAADFRWAGVNDGSKRGPPGAAAVMCAPTPTLLTPFCLLGPNVGAWHFGFEHRWPTS